MMLATSAPRAPSATAPLVVVVVVVSAVALLSLAAVAASSPAASTFCTTDRTTCVSYSGGVETLSRHAVPLTTYSGAVVSGSSAATFAGATLASDGASIVSKWYGATWWATRQVWLGGGSGEVHVQTTLRASGANVTQAVRIDDRHSFVPGVVSIGVNGSAVSSPSLRFHDGDLSAPHWQFKAPALILQKGALAVTMLPDLNWLTAATIEATPPFMDLVNDAASGEASMSYGAAFTRLTAHSIYAVDPTLAVALNGTDGVQLRYVLLLRSDAAPGQAYGDAVAYLWQEVGHGQFVATPTIGQAMHNESQLTFETWRPAVWHAEAASVYAEWACGIGGSERCATLTSYSAQGWYGPCCKATPTDGWYQAWFNQARTAYGWYLYGQRSAQPAIMLSARAVVNTLVHAPQHPRGPLPATMWLRTPANGTAPASVEWGLDFPFGGNHSYHMFSNAWAAIWLVRFAELTADVPRVLPMVTRLADFIVGVQRADGFVASYWVPADDGSLQPQAELGDLNSEVAAVGWFLALAADVVAATDKARAAKYQQAARAALTYQERQILPQQIWADFETYFSCSPKPSLNYKDNSTGQWAENNLSKIAAAGSYLTMYHVTGDGALLATGLRVLEQLLLTQQVWQHVYLAPLPQGPRLLGGWTTQNSDAEWSDARNAYAADVLLAYYRATGNPHYLERGIASMRASLAVAPYENFDHSGGLAPGAAITGMHWSTGSGMASVEMAADWLLDAYVNGGMAYNATEAHGAGVNGASVRAVSIVGTQLRVELCVAAAAIPPPSATAATFRVAVDGLPKAVQTAVVNACPLPIVANAKAAAAATSGYVQWFDSAVAESIVSVPGDCLVLCPGSS